jgi:hypothetical protein
MAMNWRSLIIALIGAVLLVSSSVRGQVAAARTFTHERDIQTAFQWHELPRWDSGRLVLTDTHRSKGPIIFTFDSDGRDEQTSFTLKDAALISVFDVAAAQDGELALAGSAVTTDTRATCFVARIAADRNNQIVTRTWPYCSMVLTFAPDGTLWTLGHLKDEEDTREIQKNVLRRFDASGKLISSSNLTVNGPHTPDASYLRASRDRVGWFAPSNEYFEFALDGSEIGHYDGPPGADFDRISGVAISDQNEVVAAWFGKRIAQIMTLDRASKKWTPVSLTTGTPAWARVLGFDGTTLIMYSKNGEFQRFR